MKTITFCLAAISNVEIIHIFIMWGNSLLSLCHKSLIKESSFVINKLVELKQ